MLLLNIVDTKTPKNDSCSACIDHFNDESMQRRIFLVVSGLFSAHDKVKSGNKNYHSSDYGKKPNWQ